MPENEWEAPSCNWFGGYLIARELLAYTKSNVDDNDKDSFLAKVNRQNFIIRVQLVLMALQQYGPTLEAAQAIQGDGKGFFTDLTAEVLAEKLSEAVAKLKSGSIWKFSAMEFGSLDFSKVPGDSEAD